MLQNERSVAIPTGMIIAALYVILLVGFSRESYMRREAANLDLGSGPDLASADYRADAEDVSKRVCRIVHPICATLFTDPGKRQSCAFSMNALRNLVGEDMPVLQGLRQTLRTTR